MASLLRFRKNDTFFKARLFERASSKHICVCCGNRDFGILVRHIEPKKLDSLICEKCLINITLGNTIEIKDKPNYDFGAYEVSTRIKYLRSEAARKKNLENLKLSNDYHKNKPEVRAELIEKGKLKEEPIPEKETEPETVSVSPETITISPETTTFDSGNTTILEFPENITIGSNDESIKNEEVIIETPKENIEIESKPILVSNIPDINKRPLYE